MNDYKVVYSNQSKNAFNRPRWKCPIDLLLSVSDMPIQAICKHPVNITHYFCIGSTPIATLNQCKNGEKLVILFTGQFDDKQEKLSKLFVTTAFKLSLKCSITYVIFIESTVAKF